MTAPKKYQTYSKQGKIFISFFLPYNWVCAWWDGDRKAKYDITCNDLEVNKSAYGHNAQNNIPTQVFSREWCSLHICEENISLVLFPFSFSLGRKLLDFVCLPLNFDSELITSCDVVIWSLWYNLWWPNFHLQLLIAVFYWLSASEGLK